MVLANRAKLQNSRSLVRVFGGLNETYACSEAEYSAGVNFSARDFPALSTRKPRRKLRELTGLNGMYHLNGLLTVCGKDLIYTPDADGANPVTCTEAVTDGRWKAARALIHGPKHFWKSCTRSGITKHWY